MPGVVVHSVYKPPNEKFVLPALGYGKLPHIVIGDFNSHNTTWGYTTTDDNGEAVEQWADSCNITLIHNAKLSKSFISARWKRGYNPDLIFVSESITNMCGKSVMKPIPHTQHRPICERAAPVIVAQPIPFRRRFYLRKTDWNSYAAALRTATGCTQDTNIQHLHDETLILPIHDHLQLHASQYKQKTQHPSHPLHKHRKKTLSLTTAATPHTFPHTPTLSHIPPHSHYNRHKNKPIVSMHLATRGNTKILAHLHHTLAAVKRYFLASFVTPLPNSENK